MTARRPILVLAFAALAACGTTDPSDPDNTPPPPGSPDAGVVPENMERLITTEFSVAPGSEKYLCTRITLTDDVFIRAIAPVNNPGLHHLVLAAGEPTEPDGTVPCGGGGAEIMDGLFASGVGSPPLEFPPGVGYKLEAGTQILLNSHLFNTTDAEIVSETGLDVERIAAEDVEQEAEFVTAGTLSINIQPGESKTIGSQCTMNGSANIFSVFPHMHQLGTHMKVWLENPGEQVVYDQPWVFDEQAFATFDPIAVNAGDKLRVECSYTNTTGSVVQFGESSNDEMCFAFFYRYPKLSQGGALDTICLF